MDESRPIFVQIAELVEADIVSGALPEGAQAPSINEFAAFHRINPATALKGVTLLVDAGILEKRRGVGMFVVEGARGRILARRRGTFEADYLAPLLAEAAALEIDADELVESLRRLAARRAAGPGAPDRKETSR